MNVFYHCLILTVFTLLFFQTSCNAEQSNDIVQDSSNMENFTTRDFEIKNTKSGNTESRKLTVYQLRMSCRTFNASFALSAGTKM